MLGFRRRHSKALNLRRRQQQAAYQVQWRSSVLEMGYVALCVTTFYNVAPSLDTSFTQTRTGLFTLITGYLCLITQLVLYVWCTESSGIKGAVLFIAIVTSIPLLDLLLPIEFFRRQEKATSQQDEKNFQQEPKTTSQTPIARHNGPSRV